MLAQYAAGSNLGMRVVLETVQILSRTQVHSGRDVS